MHLIGAHRQAGEQAIQEGRPTGRADQQEGSQSVS